MRIPLIAASSLLLGAAGGAGLRWALAPSAEPASARKGRAVVRLAPGTDRMRGGTGAAVSAALLPQAGVAGIEQLLAMRGFAQLESIGLWLQSAGTEDLKAFVLALKDQETSDTSIHDALFLRWAELDAPGALTFSRSHGYDNILWWAWGKVDPDKALAAALLERESYHGCAVLRGIAQNDPERARELFAQYPQFADRVSLEGLVSSLMRTDPAAAAELALTVESTDVVDSIESWTLREPDAALAWALGLESPGQRERFLKAVIGQLQETSPEKVASALAALPPGITRNRLIAEHAGYLALTNSAAALAFAKEQTNPAVRQASIAAIAGALVPERPQQALDILRSGSWKTGDPANRSGVSGSGVYEVVKDLMRHLPEETMQFTQELGTDSAAHGLRHRAFEGWLEADIGKASEWLAAQPAAQRDRSTVESLVNRLMHGADQDFEAAVTWAATLTDPNGYNSQLRYALESWRRSDPEAARAALSLPVIPEKLREQLTPTFSQP
jgi:hypothetical protein